MLKGLLNRKKVLRRAGDAARQRGDWKFAEENYRRHLIHAPDDVAIWIQLGHVVKEQHLYSEAANAYYRAVELNPSDDEAWLHLAHVLLRANQPDRALKAFEQSHALSGRRESYENASALGATIAPLRAATRPATTYLLLDDLLMFLAGNVTLSGIQRTQVGILSNLLGQFSNEFKFLLTSENPKDPTVTFWEMPLARVKTLIDYISTGADLERNVLDVMLNDATGESRRASFSTDDIVFVLGAFWIIGKTAMTLSALKAAGAKIGVYVYDLIPISHPEFCHEFLVEQFARSFTEMVQFVDFFATISEYVSTVLADFINTHGLRPVPITTIPLAHFLTVPNLDQAPNSEFVQKISESTNGRPYALYVSTLEGRKNHLYVLNVWQELARRGVEMPDLIFLGRKGWRVEGLFSFLDATHYLNGRVHLLHDIGDGDLAHLYRECQFTLFTSYVEGWGLPVGESLVYGKPCIASNGCSIPEVGGDLVDYVDPMNLRDGVRVVERLVTDRGYREDRARNIAKSFAPRSWADVTLLFVQLIRKAHTHSSVPLKPFYLRPLETYDLTTRDFDITDVKNLLEFPNRLVLGTDFYDLEPGQTWMRGNCGIIDLPTSLPEGSTALVAVSLVMPPWNSKCLCAVVPTNTNELEAKSRAHPIVQRSGVPLVATVAVKVDVNGIASLQIWVFNPLPDTGADGRRFNIGVRSIAYEEADPTFSKPNVLACFADVEAY